MQPALLASACSWDWPESGEPPWARPGVIGCPKRNGAAKSPTIATATNRRLKVSRTLGSSVGQLHVHEDVVERLRIGAAARGAADRGIDVLESAARQQPRGAGGDHDVLVQVRAIHEAKA